MLCDAHVHVGYFSRKGYDKPFYYSPRRVVGVLNRCGVDEFIVSSTCAQVEGIGIKEIIREAKEVKRLAGCRAHISFWLSGRLYDEDPGMRWLDSGLFEGLKLHDGETPWMQRRQKDLRSILSVAEERGLPVIFHSGPVDGCRPVELVAMANEFPDIRFNFAYCRPMGEMAKVIADCPNVWTDTAYMALDEFPRLRDYDWHDRLMFGTDLPVWQSHDDVGLTKRYREYVCAFRATRLEEDAGKAFRKFCQGSCKKVLCP